MKFSFSKTLYRHCLGDIFSLKNPLLFGGHLAQKFLYVQRIFYPKTSYSTGVILLKNHFT